MRLRWFVLLSISLLVSACSTVKTKFSPDDLLILPDKPIANAPSSVSSKEVKEDIKYLMYALDRGYAGKDYLPRDSYRAMVDRLEAINQSQSPESLRDQIDEVLADTPDNHLNAKINWKPSAYRLAKSEKGSVGKNFFSGNAVHPWAIETRKLNQKKILLISIVAFPNHEDAAWKGFLEQVEAQLPKADVAIIDLRGNGGGDDTVGDELAWIFYGRNFDTPFLQQTERITPEAHALYVNMYAYQMARNVTRGIPPSEFLTIHYQKTLNAFEWSKANQTNGYLIKSEGVFETTRTHGKNITPFKRPVFLLMDRSCDSSCESTIAAFEYLPNAKKVGENTGGYIHFGNVSDVVLPHSKIVVQMGTHFTQYKDSRFIEKKGIEPDIRITAGEDALAFALKSVTVRE